MVSKKNSDIELSSHVQQWQLDDEEREVLQLLEEKGFALADDSKMLATEAEIAAKRYFEKKARLNIRITEADLSRLKRKAAQEGLPYQTLAASILHKYVSGSL